MGDIIYRLESLEKCKEKWYEAIPSQGPLLQNDSNLYFGRHRTLGRYFLGELDDIRLYDGALSQSQVNALLIPEPATVALLAIGALTLLRRRK